MTTTTVEMPATALRFRTEQERQADRYAARAFFARFDGYRPGSSDWRWRRIQTQIIEREVLDSKLLVAASEAHEWSQLHKDGPKERAAKRAITDGNVSAQELVLDPNMLRDYTDAQTRWSLPAPRLGALTTKERAKHRAAGRLFTTLITTALHTPDPRAAHHRAAPERETFPFAQWLLRAENWSYGLQLPEPFEGFDGHLRPAAPHRSPLTHYRAGRITVVGMTPERALRIAIAAAAVTEHPASVSRAERRAAREQAEAEAEARRLERAARLELAKAAKERDRLRMAADRALEARQGGY